MGTLNGEDRQVLLYLQDARRLSQRIGALDRMMAYENENGEQWHRRVIEKAHEETLEALLDAAAAMSSLGSVEGDVLTCLYAFGYTGKETAGILGYSEERVWSLAKRGRKRLRGLERQKCEE